MIVQDGVQVVTNRKVFRDFSCVRVVQQWQAHTGVIWTVSFSDTGAFMATGGKDQVIRVWENRRAPVEAGCMSPLLPLLRRYVFPGTASHDACKR